MLYGVVDIKKEIIFFGDFNVNMLVFGNLINIFYSDLV